MQIGQCLPSACSVSAVQSILEADPAANVLKFSKAKPHNELRVQDVRKVPGDYDAWTDKKLLIFWFVLRKNDLQDILLLISFSFVTIFFVALMIFATFYERSLQSNGYRYIGGVMLKASVVNDETSNNNNSSDTEIPLKNNFNLKLSKFWI